MLFTLSIILLSPEPITYVDTLHIQPIVAEAKRSKKKGKKSSLGSGGSNARFSSCAAARAAGYSHMRRGQKGYSPNLDRDGDGVACDK
jgi:hypothetical protein